MRNNSDNRRRSVADQHYFEVVQARSGTGRPDGQKRTLAGLGLGRIGRTVSLRDTPPIRGMI